MKRRLIGWVLLLACAANPVAALEILSLDAAKRPQGEHVVLRLSEAAEVKVFSVDELPARVVIDMPTVHWRTPPASMAYGSGLIERVRLGMHDANTSRLVFDLSASVTPRHVKMIHERRGDAYRLSFDLVSGPGKAVSVERNEKTVAYHEPREKAVAASKNAFTDAHVSARPMIIIDAGHGGQDPGTSGRGGTQEKQLTLRYASALRDALLKTGRYRVTLTRSDDTYLFLRDRVARARAAGGDLFISLHADSAPTRSARGLSVYTISETASDKESAALAAKENKADVIGGLDLSDTSADVADILIDLAERETREKSAQFADLAIRNLGREVNLLSNTHRFAGFAVLKAPDIPSVLIEIGFLTTPEEERQLKSGTYQGKVVHALVQAINSYFGKGK